MLSKQTLRKQMRSERRNLIDQVRDDAGLAVLTQLRKLSLFHSSRATGLYLANDGELPLSAVVDDIWKRKQRCLLPIIFGYRQRKLHFSDYHKNVLFKTNQYGIAEPVSPPSKQLKPFAMDLVLMPLVAFDPEGNRLGMGGGYYDRSFAFLNRRRYWRRPYLVGVAYDFQQVDALAFDSWDVPLNAIVTPTQLIRC